MYRFYSKVRYSEIEQNGYLSIPSIINYFQDCSTFQSEEAGVGIEWLKERKRCWVISSWQIKVLRQPRLGEEIAIETYPYELKGCFGMRNFLLKDHTGKELAIANTLWTYIDTEKMKPAKIEAEVEKAYKLDAPYPEAWKGRKIICPTEGQQEEAFIVGKSLLDTNGHVNNEKYVELAMEYLPKNFAVTSLRVEYKKSAMYMDKMIPVVIEIENGFVISLNDTDGSVYAISEFEGQLQKQ